MKLYLSSYKIGNQAEKLREMLEGLPKKIAYIANSIDYRDESYARTEETFIEFQNRGFEVNEIDLRKYFSKESELETELCTYGMIRVRGGNTFVLRQAMFLSGMDNIIKKMHNENFPIVYGGYSAGGCILSKNMVGLEIVDQPEIKCYGDEIPVMRDGLGLIDYLFIPHYKSDHPESKMVDNTVEHCDKNGIAYKTLSDGDVIII